MRQPGPASSSPSARDCSEPGEHGHDEGGLLHVPHPGSSLSGRKGESVKTVYSNSSRLGAVDTSAMPDD